MGEIVESSSCVSMKQLGESDSILLWLEWLDVGNGSRTSQAILLVMELVVGSPGDGMRAMYNFQEVHRAEINLRQKECQRDKIKGIYYHHRSFLQDLDSKRGS